MSRLAAIVDTGRAAGGWLSGACGSGRGVLWIEKRKRQTAGGVGRGTWPAIYMEKNHLIYGKMSAPACLALKNLGWKWGKALGIA